MKSRLIILWQERNLLKFIDANITATYRSIDYLQYYFFDNNHSFISAVSKNIRMFKIHRMIIKRGYFTYNTPRITVCCTHRILTIEFINELIHQLKYDNYKLSMSELVLCLRTDKNLFDCLIKYLVIDDDVINYYYLLSDSWIQEQINHYLLSH